MDKEYTIIQETPNHQKVKVFFVTLLFAVVMVGAVISSMTLYSEAITASRPFMTIKNFIVADISKFTPVGLFYLGLAGGLFFVPLPIEAFFFQGLLNGNPIMLSLLLVLAGVIPGQGVSYFIGSRFSRVVMMFTSRKKVYKVKRWANRFGSYAVFVFNMLPLPSPILTFALGITRYNVIRLYVFMILGNLVKYGVIIGFVSLF